ncbi:terminase small subunit [Psychrobacter celer]|uniref:terminase small subunit n=1 Tax=Psychrobacter celer TaxID=306572 RepID=UPI003FD2ACDA
MTNEALDSVKLTDKQQRFVDEYLVDSNATQAAIRSGYSVDSARQSGYDNMTKPYIQDAIAEGRAKIVKRNAITIDDLINELEQARTAAMTAETAQSSAAVAATMGKAKMLGFLIDKKEHSGKDGEPLFPSITVKYE